MSARWDLDNIVLNKFIQNLLLKRKHMVVNHRFNQKYKDFQIKIKGMIKIKISQI
jgi:ribosomal protein S24E